MSEEPPLPIIDLGKFGQGSTADDQTVAEQLFKACKDVGFAYLISTGIPDETVDEMFDWSQRFFELPYETKMLAPHPPEGWKHRGFSSAGLEQISQMVFDDEELAKIRRIAPDYKESFDFGSSDGPLENIWLPAGHLDGMQNFSQDFYYKCRDLQKKTLQCLSLGMFKGAEPADFFNALHSDGNNQLRLLHYPAFSTTERKGRLNPHTDFCTCTFLFQGKESGLEVEYKDRFIPVKPLRGGVVFNIGDSLMRWTNDLLKSTMHKVVPEPDPITGDVPVRYSIPFFCAPNADVVLDALPGTFSDSNPKKYEPVNCMEYINMRLNATYK